MTREKAFAIPAQHVLKGRRRLPNHPGVEPTYRTILGGLRHFVMYELFPCVEKNVHEDAIRSGQTSPPFDPSEGIRL